MPNFILRTAYQRHARPCAGHPRLSPQQQSKTWMAGTSPAMTHLALCPKAEGEQA
jgi:hypothetical protein